MGIVNCIEPTFYCFKMSWVRQEKHLKRVTAHLKNTIFIGMQQKEATCWVTSIDVSINSLKLKLNIKKGCDDEKAQPPRIDCTHLNLAMIWIEKGHSRGKKQGPNPPSNNRKQRANYLIVLCSRYHSLASLRWQIGMTGKCTTVFD